MTPNLENSNLSYLNKYSPTESIEGGLNISEFTNILLRKLPLIAGCTLAMGSLALLKVVLTPPEYVAGFELLSEPVNIETTVTSADADSRETREEITEVELDEVQLKILKSPQLILRVVKSLRDQYPDLDYQGLAEGLTIEILSGNQQEQNILQVFFEDPDKQKVADVVEALNQTYQKYSVEKRQSGIKRGIAFLDRQIPEISNQREKIENQITNLRTQYNFNNPDSSLAQITSRINELSVRQDENEIKLQELRLTLSNLERDFAIQPAKSITALGLATPRYLALIDKLRQLDETINQKSVVFAEGSETMQVLEQEKQQLNSLIVEAGAGIRQKLIDQIAVLENRQRSLTDETERLKSQLKQWSAISGQYKSLQHQLNRTNVKLNEFTSQKDALQIDAARQESPWQLLTPATEPETNSINTINYLVLGSTLGLLIGVGAAFVLDKQQKIIYSSAKVEELTNLPILATIPYISQNKNLPFLKQISPSKEQSPSFSITQITELERSLYQSPQLFVPDSIEAFRSFAANLGILNFSSDSTDFQIDTSLKSIAISSAVSEEGKSTVALNLARASASMGKKVLLVDTDLRNINGLTKILSLESKIGLRNILNRENSDLGLNYINPISFEKNLYILTSGFESLETNLTRLDPSRLLASVKMRSLMEELRNHFDLVIYDMCAINEFADVNLLAAKTDGILMVAGLGKLQSVALNEALTQLKLCKAPVLGVAANRIVQ